VIDVDPPPKASSIDPRDLCAFFLGGMGHISLVRNKGVFWRCGGAVGPAAQGLERFLEELALFSFSSSEVSLCSKLL